MKVTRVHCHDYLAMMFEFSNPGKLMINQIKYIKTICKEFPKQLGKVKCPWTEKIFRVDIKYPKFTEAKSKKFHKFIMKLMFV